jgi:hypothetical protein
MPKIKTVFESFGGKSEEFLIWYDNKQKFFIRGGFPMHIMNVLGDQIVTSQYDSPDDLTFAISQFAKDYNLAITTTRKVIIFSITMGDDTIDELELVGTKYKGSVGNSNKGHGFSIEFTFGMERKIGEKTVINELIHFDPYKTKRLLKQETTSDDYDESHHTYNLRHDETVIEWTPEREKFFFNLKGSITELCKKIIEFMGKDDRQILKAIDSGVKMIG